MTTSKAEQAGKAIHSIANSISVIREMNKQNAEATERQMQLSRDITTNLVNISDAAAKTTTSMTDVNDVSHAVNETASKSASRVNQFKI